MQTGKAQQVTGGGYDIGGVMLPNNRPDREAAQEQVLPLTPAAFRRAWVDDSLTCQEVGARFGMSKYAAWRCAKALDLPKKKGGQRANPDRDAKITQLWNMAASTSQICAVVGLSKSGVLSRADDLGLPKRPRGRAAQMTLARARETLLAKAMAETARIEQRQIKLAEMWDQPGHNTSGKRKAA